MFRHYESFSENGSPQVLIPLSVINRYGEPSVNSEGLGELFEEELDLPADDITIKFYKGNEIGNPLFFFSSWSYGRILPITNTLHVAAYDGDYDTPMEKVITLGYLMSDRSRQSIVRRLLRGEVTVASSAALGLGIADKLTVPGLLGFVGLAYVGMMQSTNMNTVYTFNKHHERIRNLRKSHDSDITFSKQEHIYLDQNYGGSNVKRRNYIKRIK